ncbi:hypothetical protein ABPG72_013467 [Tetrahymena utriculariae]
MSCVVELYQIPKVNLCEEIKYLQESDIQQSIVQKVQANQALENQKQNVNTAELNNAQVIIEFNPKEKQQNQDQIIEQPQLAMEKCKSIETEPQNMTAEMASFPFQNITKQTQKEFEDLLNYNKSSNAKSKYVVFREININNQQIQETSSKIKKSSNLQDLKFSNFSDFKLATKNTMLQSVLESIDTTQVAQPEELKKEFINSDYYRAIELFANKFQSLYRWNVFLLIFQNLFIQAAFIIGFVKYYSHDTEKLIELIIILSTVLSFVTELFLIYRSKYFLQKEGNDYLFIIVALVQALAGIVAVSFEMNKTSASITTLSYLLYLLSYMFYILFLIVIILPRFEFLKDTFFNFIYSEPISQKRS